ncbi:MAG: acyl-CoA dehydrogenase family protein [Candidatus Alcyoniella australis]|nr:acyl-CoA dehydrogenase family protein [Candidatus Alcyoniella australis]
MEFSFTPEQLAFREQVLKFASKEIEPLAEESDLKSEWCAEAWRKLGEFGILGLHFPEEYGGSNADVVTACLAGEALAEGGADGGLMLAYGAHSFLCGDTIMKHGTEEQKQRYLPKLATGEWIGAMGLTEPDAGSDAVSIRTRAEKRDGGWVLNGTKMFITNGPLADVVVVFAVTDKDAGPMGITAFFVEKDTPGFKVGKVLHKLGVRASTTSELIFEDALVPEENVLGQIGAGFLVALGALEWDRSALLAPGIGGTRRILDLAAQYACERKQFGRPIAQFQAVQHKLADLRIFYEVGKLLVYRVAWNKDQGRPMNHLDAAVSKLYMGEQSMLAASDAVQIFGGYGLMHEYPVERYFRDAKLTSIGGGTSEVQRMIISRFVQGER